jgi:hypothetical protein
MSPAIPHRTDQVVGAETAWDDAPSARDVAACEGATAVVSAAAAAQTPDTMLAVIRFMAHPPAARPALHVGGQLRE